MLRRALAWHALPFVVLAAAGLTVDSLSPDALCPPLEETRSAVAARLGSVDLEGTWRATYLLVHRNQGDFVALTLRDPSGAVRLERDLPVKGGSCATVSRVIALVLERFFMRPEQAAPAASAEEPEEAAGGTAPPTESPVATSPAPRLTPPVAAIAPRVSLPPSGRKDVGAATSEPAPYRLSAAAWATTAWLAPRLTLDRELAGPYRLGLGAAVDLAREELSVFEGSAQVRRVPLTLGCERQFPLTRSANAEAGLDLLGLVERASTHALAKSGSGLRLVPGLGLRLGARFLTDERVQPFAQVTGHWLLRAAAPAFRVGDNEVLRPPVWAFGVALGLGTPF